MVKIFNIRRAHIEVIRDTSIVWRTPVLMGALHGGLVGKRRLPFIRALTKSEWKGACQTKINSPRLFPQPDGSTRAHDRWG